MSFNIQPRRSLIVYLNNPRQAKQLRRFGVIAYISNQFSYAVIYMNEDEIKKKQEIINRLGFVKKVDVSQWPEVDSTVGNGSDGVAFTVDDVELDEIVVDEEEV
ncbi:hypothetical protein IV73_GL000754 [Weissella kandleri]|uniref:Uncharacterized protein n=1 Tax=Weissella kandleri TaxID=1616 RepID=A0A0R2JIE2_9LACO|nr:YlbG family protein [Weissella kandleri]KRN74997.1 hypothetical protein IV73_GL000754 [Weissella kandleri]